MMGTDKKLDKILDYIEAYCLDIDGLPRSWQEADVYCYVAKRDKAKEFIKKCLVIK